MDIDVARVLGLVTRAVRNFEKDGKPASAVTLTRLYDTGVDDLWDALTSRERIPRWFLPVGAGFGLLTGFTAGMGPILSPFFLSYGLRRGAYIGTMALGVLGVHIARVTVFGSTGFLNPHVLVLGLWLIRLALIYFIRDEERVLLGGRSKARNRVST